MLSSLAIALSLALFVSSSAVPRRRGQGRLVTSCSMPNTAALTFDDGPYIYMTEIVDTLKVNNARGTFFVNGMNWGCIYDENNVQSMKYALDNGMQIGSHTWSHKDLSTLGDDELRSEMSRSNDAICKTTGMMPAFMRPPFGAYNDAVLSIAGEFNQVAVTWNLDSGDSLGADIETQKQACTSVVSQHPEGIISLQHEVYDTSVHETLPNYIQQLQGAGYTLVTVAECLGEAAYIDGGCADAASSDGWSCQ